MGVAACFKGYTPQLCMNKATFWRRVAVHHHFIAYPDLIQLFTLMRVRIRIQLFTLMRIRIQLFFSWEY
jgi:hypothetical protein